MGAAEATDSRGLRHIARSILKRATAAAAVILAAVTFCPAQGGPPMMTDDTETVPPGRFEINLGVIVESGAEGRLFRSPIVDLNYGVSKRVQIKAEIPWLTLHQKGLPAVRGTGNMGLGVKWRFRDRGETGGLALSFYPSVEFNSPGHAVRKGLVEKGPELLLPLEWQTHAGRFGINGDVGYRIKRGRDEVMYGVLLGREFRRFELLAEMHGTGPARRLSRSEIVVNFGTRVFASRHLNLMWSAGHGLIPGRHPRSIAYAGFQINF